MSDKKALPILIQEAQAKKKYYQELLNKSNYKSGDAKKERAARTHALCQIGGVLSAAMNKHPVEIDAELLSAVLHRFKIKLPDQSVSLGEYLSMCYARLESGSE